MKIWHKSAATWWEYSAVVTRHKSSKQQYCKSRC